MSDQKEVQLLVERGSIDDVAEKLDVPADVDTREQREQRRSRGYAGRRANYTQKYYWVEDPNDRTRQMRVTAAQYATGKYTKNR